MPEPTTPALSNPAAERAVIGSLLLDNGCRADIGDLPALDFADERHMWLVGKILQIIDGGGVADFITVMDAVEREQVYGRETGLTDSYLVGILAETVTASHAAHYAGIVRRDAARRRLLDAATQLAQLAYQPDVDDLAGRAQILLDRVAPGAAGPGQLLPWADSFPAFAANQTQEAAERAADQPQLTLPWRSLRWVRALQPGALAIVAGDSGQGKTALLECCAETWARRGFRVLFAHTELAHREMLKRRICRWAGLSMAQVDGLGLNAQMRQASDLAAQWPGAVDYFYAGGASAGEVIAAARAARRNGGADVVVVDYLQDLRHTEYVRGQTTADMRGGDVQALKRLAETAGLAILAGAQYNRGSEAEKTRHRIRDSAWYDLKASLILLIDRKRLDKPLFGADGLRIADTGEYSPETTITVDKQTGGKTGRAPLWYVGGRFLFTDVADVGTTED